MTAPYKYKNYSETTYILACELSGPSQQEPWLRKIWTYGSTQGHPP